jgi:hypothetical protein
VTISFKNNAHLGHRGPPGRIPGLRRAARMGRGCPVLPMTEGAVPARRLPSPGPRPGTGFGRARGWDHRAHAVCHAEVTGAEVRSMGVHSRAVAPADALGGAAPFPETVQLLGGWFSQDVVDESPTMTRPSPTTPPPPNPTWSHVLWVNSTSCWPSLWTRGLRFGSRRTRHGGRSAGAVLLRCLVPVRGDDTVRCLTDPSPAPRSPPPVLVPAPIPLGLRRRTAWTDSRSSHELRVVPAGDDVAGP